MSNYKTQMCLARQSAGKQERAVLAKSNAVLPTLYKIIKKNAKMYMICCSANVSRNGMQYSE